MDVLLVMIAVCAVTFFRELRRRKRSRMLREEFELAIAGGHSMHGASAIASQRHLPIPAHRRTVGGKRNSTKWTLDDDALFESWYQATLSYHRREKLRRRD